MPPCPPRPPAPLSRGPGPTGPRGFNASSRCSDPRLRQAPQRVPPSKPTSLRPARSPPGPGGRARLPGRGESEGGRRGRRGAGRAGRDAEGRAGLRLLQPPLGSRAAGGGTRDPAGRQRAQLGPPPPHEPRCPHPQSSGPAASPRLPAAPSPRDAPRGRTRAAESGVPAPERRRGRRRANAGPWGAQTCGACGLRKVSPRVVGGCGGWESCLGTGELRFAK